MMFNKLFSVGLNLGEPEEEIKKFIGDYCEYLSSIYFSLPLGDRFYSRTELKKEYEAKHAFEKLKRLIIYMRQLGIRSELTVNSYGLRIDDLKIIKPFVCENEIDIDEIVCLDEYASFLRTAFPNVELKYSFNNKDPQNIPNIFDTVVVGKKYLRSNEDRERIYKTGKKVIFLVNNGCNFNCTNRCGGTAYCEKFLNAELLENDVNYIYAQQSFFPNELRKLIYEVPNGIDFGIKISNRPLGLRYTRVVIDMYMSDDMEKVWEYLRNDIDNYCIFCTMASLMKYRNQFNLDEIRRYKDELHL